jgi:hypothetical protein
MQMERLLSKFAISVLKVKFLNYLFMLFPSLILGYVSYYFDKNDFYTNPNFIILSEGNDERFVFFVFFIFAFILLAFQIGNIAESFVANFKQNKDSDTSPGSSNFLFTILVGVLLINVLIVLFALFGILNKTTLLVITIMIFILFHRELNSTFSFKFRFFSVIKFCFFSIFFILLIIKYALPINSDGDYVTHYLPYINSVTSIGSSGPNEYWYQYWYSFGNGVGFIFNMILDSNGQQLSGVLYFSILLLVLIYFLNYLGVVGIYNYLAILLIIVPIVKSNFAMFTKHHGFFALTILCLVVILTKILQSKDLINSEKILLYLLPISGILIYPSSVALFCLTIFIPKLRNRFRYFFTIVISYLIVLSTTYVKTGLPDATPWRFWRSFALEDTLYKIASPYLVALLDLGSDEKFGRFSLSNFNLTTDQLLSNQLYIKTFLTSNVFKLSIFLLIILFILSAIYGVVYFDRSTAIISNFFILVTIVIIFTIFASGQPISLVRSTWFFPILVFILLTLTLKNISFHFSRHIDVKSIFVLFIVTILTLSVIKNVIPSSSSLQYLKNRIPLLGNQVVGSENYNYDLSEFIISDSTSLNRNYFSTSWSSLVAPIHFTNINVATEVSSNLGTENYERIVFGTEQDAIDAFSDLGIKRIILTPLGANGLIPTSTFFSPKSLTRNTELIWHDGGNICILEIKSTEDDFDQEINSENKCIGFWSDYLNETSLVLRYKFDYLFLKNGFNPEKLIIPPSIKPGGGWQ